MGNKPIRESHQNFPSFVVPARLGGSPRSPMGGHHVAKESSYSLEENSSSSPLHKALALASCLMNFLAAFCPVGWIHWAHQKVLQPPWEDPSIPPCWTLECWSESIPKLEILLILDSCWIGLHPHEQRPSKPAHTRVVLFVWIARMVHYREISTNESTTCGLLMKWVAHV